MQDPKNRATLPFDSIEPGDAVGTLEYTLTPELVDRHRRATGQKPYADPDVAPISMLSQEGVNLADRFWDISQSVHAGQRLEVLALPRIGDVLTVTSVAGDKFVRRGRRYVVSNTETKNEKGEVVARGITTGVVVYAEGSSDGPRETPPAADEAPALEVLTPIERMMTREHMVLYEPPGEVNIHTSDEVAREAGLPGAIATGTHFLAYLFELLHETYGPRSLVGTIMDARIRLPVFAGDRVEACGEVVARDERIHHRMRCRTEHGDAILATASVLAP
jgi:acyl dehydratase